ncbi:MAG: DsbA family protein [Pseudomonadota bacterium]
MKLAQQLRSIALSVVMGPGVQRLRRRLAEWVRRVAGRKHRVDVFLELDDPYSYLLSRYLPDLAARNGVDVRIYVVQALDEGYRPRPDLQAQYAQIDCERLARELGIPFLDRGQAPPVEHRLALIDSLAEQEQADDYAEQVNEALSLYWRGDSESVARRLLDISERKGPAMLARNQALLESRGHYNSAMLHYAGEWYWGVDRLHYLEERLDALGAHRADASAPKIASLKQVSKVTLPVTPPNAATPLPALEFFFSFRSPYTYFAMERAFAIADAFGLKLTLRPVLPMVMRGLPVPRNKLLYIAADTAREARRLEIPFGKFADPLGAGIERCLATYYYAVAEKREREFMVNAAQAIWAERIDVATDAGLRKVTGRTGLFWPDVLAALGNDQWRAEVEQNRADMMDAGSWGVPTVRLGEFVVWGQDRLWMLVRHIEDQCETGEGILI